MNALLDTVSLHFITVSSVSCTT